MNHTGHEFYHLVGRLQGRSKHGLPEGAEVCAERDRFRDVHASANSSRCDQFYIRQGLAYADQRFLRRNTPVGKDRVGPLAHLGRTLRLDGGPGSAALAGDIDGLDAGAVQTPGDFD